MLARFGSLLRKILSCNLEKCASFGFCLKMLTLIVAEIQDSQNLDGRTNSGRVSLGRNQDHGDSICFGSPD